MLFHITPFNFSRTLNFIFNVRGHFIGETGGGGPVYTTNTVHSMLLQSPNMVRLVQTSGTLHF